MTELTPHKVRHLTSTDLGVDLPGGSSRATAPSATMVGDIPAVLTVSDLSDDPVVLTVNDLLQDYGGVLFTGPPGTSKSYYASLIAEQITGSPARVRTVQFHPSYQYEDFMQGYVLTPAGTVFRDKHFVIICKDAARHPNDRFVIVIDELSRADPGRVFGEALTYIERSKRGQKFFLASGEEMSVPANLEILATMNPLDRGVDEVDAALNRRFAKYAMDPNEDLLNTFLVQASMADELRERVLLFFRMVNREANTAANPHAALGHTYFQGIQDIPGLTRLWDHQLRFHFEQAYRLDSAGLGKVRSDWDRITTTLPPGSTNPS
jgi:5-methylcytosine-specific restriction protein B